MPSLTGANTSNGGAVKCGTQRAIESWRSTESSMRFNPVSTLATVLLIVLFSVGAVGTVTAWWIGVHSELDKLALDRIIDEVQSGFYSGRVLAGRLERLNRFRCRVPSLLTEVLGVQPRARECKDPGGE